MLLKWGTSLVLRDFSLIPQHRKNMASLLQTLQCLILKCFFSCAIVHQCMYTKTVFFFCPHLDVLIFPCCGRGNRWKIATTWCQNRSCLRGASQLVPCEVRRSSKKEAWMWCGCNKKNHGTFNPVELVSGSICIASIYSPFFSWG